MIESHFGKTLVQIRQGRLADAEVDAVVRETDSELDAEFAPGDLVEAGGEALADAIAEARESLGDEGLKLGKAIATDAGDLKAKAVIHTTVPAWQDRYHGEKIDLEWSYHNSLVAAIEGEYETVALPAIGLGERGFPGYEATVIALNTVERVVTLHDRRTDYRGAIKRVEIVLADEQDFELYREVHRAYAHRWNDRAAG